MTRVVASAFASAFSAAVVFFFAAPAVTEARPGPLRWKGAEVEVMVDGRPAPHFFRAGAHHVLARPGDRYTLRVWNRSATRIEAVISVDGRDVFDGQPADYRSKRGYVVEAHGHIDIDGWRLGPNEVAAFRFSAAKDAYAAATGSGADIGVIGAAFFPEGYAVPLPGFTPRVRTFPLPPGWPHRGSPPAYPGVAVPLVDAGKPVVPPGPEARRPTAPSLPRAPVAATPRPPGAGTAFGERRASPVREVRFVRLDPDEPAALQVLHYDDRAGLLALGIDVDAATPASVATREAPVTPQPFPGSPRRYALPPPGWRR